jgi:hypothetical protein
VEQPNHRAEQWRRTAQQAGAALADQAQSDITRRLRIEELERELADLHTIIDGVLQSRSWRLTRPLRAAGDLVRGGTPVTDDRSATMDRDPVFEARIAAAYEAVRSTWLQPEPTTFNQKIWHRKLTDRRPILKTYCDKVATRDHVGEILPADVMQERLEVAESVTSLQRVHLPDEVIVRVSHASGGSVVIWDGPTSGGQGHHLWVRRAYSRVDVDWARIAAELDRCLDHDFGWDLLEWGYLGVPRMVVADRLYRGPDGGVPDDLYLHVFHGRVEVIRRANDRQRDTERGAGSYDRDWNPLPIHGKPKPLPFPRPTELDQAIELAEAVCVGGQTMRVDFLLTAQGLKFTEITPYTMSGTWDLTLESADHYLGSLW